MAEKKPKTVSSIQAVHDKLGLGQSTRRKVFVYFGIIIVIVALLIVASSAFARSTGVSACKHIILPQQRDQCYLTYAGTAGNVSYCGRISSRQMSYQCVSAVAEAKRDPADCSADNSYYSYYVACVENITYATGNVSYCGLLDGANGSSCAYAVATSRDFARVSYCSSISQGPDRSLCYANYYYQRAASTGNYSYCGQLGNSTNVTISESLLTNDPNATNGINSYYASDLSPSTLCYIMVGKNTRSSQACQEISNATDQSACDYYLNSTASGAAFGNATSTSTAPSPQVCNALNDSVAGQICQFTLYSNLAASQDNITKCGLISNVVYQDYCIVGLATKYNNATYCKQITNQSILGACEYQAGLSSANYTT